MRNRALTPFCAALLIVVGASWDARASQERLASAKSLYESASYEAALSELSAIDNKELIDVVDTYRALCLLGLGRVPDAEHTLELVVARRPLLTLSDAEYSPRLIALFRDVRKRALPAAAQQLYTAARTDYENKKYEAAAAGFKQALQVIAEIGPAQQSATLADLKELASGFLALADLKAASGPGPAPAAAAPAPPAREAAAGVSPSVATPVKVSAAFYTLADADVKPPAIVEQQLPRWTFSANLPARVFTGLLELMIDATGAVESVTVVEPTWPPYDASLLQAAKKWQYQPALRNGKPVRFKRTLAINIDPRAQR